TTSNMTNSEFCPGFLGIVLLYVVLRRPIAVRPGSVRPDGQSRHGFSARLSSISPYVRHNGRRAPPFARLAGRAPVRPFRLQRVPPLLRRRAPPAAPLRPRALSFRPFRPRASAWRPHGPTHPLPAIAGVQRQPGRRLWRGIFPLPPSGLALPPFAVL